MSIPLEHHDLQRGQKYENSTSGNVLEIKYADQKTVVLETKSGHRRYEPRKQFDNGIGNQWQLVEEASGEETSVQKSEKAQCISALNLLKEKLSNDKKDVTGQKVEALEEAVELLSNNEAREIPLEDVKGIGDATASKLRNKGIETELDLVAASEEYIRETPGIGNKNFSNLMEEVES